VPFSYATFNDVPNRVSETENVTSFPWGIGWAATTDQGVRDES
jgi:hypothetical protein